MHLVNKEYTAFMISSYSVQYHLLHYLSYHQRSMSSYYHIFVLLLLVQTTSVRVKSLTYYVSPSSNDGWCSVHHNSCLNLSETTALIDDRFVSNTSLILLPGNHTLLSNLSIAGHANFLMKSGDTRQPAIINCGLSSRLRINSSAYVYIYGIILNGCVENEVNAVKNFTLEDSVLSAACITNVSGSALIITNSTVVIMNSRFEYFMRSMTAESKGGVILSIQSDILILNSMFTMNSADKGGVIYCLESVVLINNSTFTKNSAIEGGVLYITRNRNTTITNKSTFQDYQLVIQWKYDTEFNTMLSISRGSVHVFCIDSNFTMNNASEGGVMYHQCVVENDNCTLHMDRSNFVFNNASYGAVFHINISNIVIHNCSFQNNKANQIGGVGYCHHSTLWINESVFCYNQAGLHAGALYFNHSTSAIINSGRFHNNVAENISAGLYLKKSNVVLIGLISFEQNSAQHNPAINVYESSITCNGTLISITNNSGSIALVHSTGHFAGYTLFKDNEGSFHIYESKVVISGHLQSIKHRSHHELQGGCVSLFLSTVMISGKVTLTNSIATNGGGILSISSTIVVDVSGMLTVVNNTATDTGGGIYLYHSELRVKGPILIQGNKAKTFGGGIHCISSIIVLICYNESDQQINLAKNEADHGGGICLEASSKFYIKWLGFTTLKQAVHYIENSANYGGAIYVADNTTTGTCASNKVQTVTTSLQTKCFIQILQTIVDYSSYPPIGDYFHFAQNLANVSGANLYGGLLDRCTVYSLGKNIQYSTISESILNDATSEPVQVCLCVLKNNSTVLNCTYSPSAMHVTKGSNLTLQIAAVDQVYNEVKATIYASLKSRKGHLREGQQTQTIGAECTNLNYSIISPIEDEDHLVLYADGPCKDLGISALKIQIRFNPCRCPIGFEPESETKDRCVCRCHHVLKSILSFIECNSKTLLIARNHDYWLSANKLGTLQYFLTYKQCPSDYCHPSTTSVYINLNSSHGPGSDVQCAFDHAGIICGSCQSNLTLSLGSSRCIVCPLSWPALSVAITVGTLLAGLALVTLILILNLTVATGTLNGMIFYANVIAINRQLFMPFEHPNFNSVFIAWLNLDVGFDVCFFKGLNAYAKAWLQLIFPVYIILIVIVVIITSHYSRKFAKLLSQKNPVATLATLILLSYAKLLHSITGVLSYAVLHYTPVDEGAPFTEVVWLRDGSIGYLGGTHIPLFIVAVLIVIAGFVYTFLLLSWQWLVKFSNKAVFLWVRNTKLSSFIDAYHAPYNARNRYWTGLLLLARVILYLTAAINISGEPSVNLLAILLVIGCILLLHAYSGISIYKKWPLNIFEFTTYFNILAFTAVKFYVQMVGGNHIAVAYTSISAQFVIFICSLLHHVMLECHLMDKAKQTRWYKSRFSRNLLSIPLLDNHVPYTAPNQKVTFSEVTTKKPELELNSEVDSEREGLTLLFSTDNSQV